MLLNQLVFDSVECSSPCTLSEGQAGSLVAVCAKIII